MTALVTRNIKRLNEIFTKEQTHVLEAAAWLMIPIVLTKISGQFINLLAASYFGTDDPGLSKFLLANSVPELMTNVLLTGAVGSIVIPTLMTVMQKESRERLFQVYSSIINASVILFTFFSVLLIIFADKLLPFIMEQIIQPIDIPSQSDYSSIISMMRVLLVPQIILGISVFISSGIKLHKRFLIPQLAPLFYNVGRIFAIIVLIPIMNYSPWAMVYGTIIGAVLHLLIQIPLFNSLGLKYFPIIKFNDEYLHEMLFLSAPRMFALSSEQIAFTLIKFLAYNFKGLISLTYANSISLIIPSLFGATFAEAAYPALSEMYESNKFDEMRALILKTLQEILYLALPFSVIFMVLRVPIVRLVFGLLPNTRFDLDGTYQVAWIILWFSIGWVFVSGRWLMYRLFYATKDTITPLIVAASSLVVMWFLAPALSNLFSHNPTYAVFDLPLKWQNMLVPITNEPVAVGGLALAISLIYTLEFFVLLIIFDRLRLRLGLIELFKASIKKILIAAITLGITYLIYKTWNTLAYALPDRAESQYTGSTTINLFILTSITVSVSFSVYYLLSLLFNINEVRIIKKMFRPFKRFFIKLTKNGDQK